MLTESMSDRYDGSLHITADLGRTGRSLISFGKMLAALRMDSRVGIRGFISPTR
jgi:hypothetical protein